MPIKEIDSQEVPSGDWRALGSQQPIPMDTPPPRAQLNSRSQRINTEACRCLFPNRSSIESFTHWTKRSLQAAEQQAEVVREMERLAGRWAKLRRAFNDWLDEIHWKKNIDRLERRKGFEFGATRITDADPFDRLMAQLLCHGESINEMEEQVESTRSYRTIQWRHLPTKTYPMDQAAA